MAPKPTAVGDVIPSGWGNSIGEEEQSTVIEVECPTLRLDSAVMAFKKPVRKGAEPIQNLAVNR